MIYYKIFTAEREYFNIRFIYDCYIITFFELYGVFLNDKAIEQSLGTTFSNKFLQFMVEDQVDQRRTDYLPCWALVKGPNYDKLMQADEGEELLLSLQNKFGFYEQTPYKTPRNENKTQYHTNIIKDIERKTYEKKEEFQRFLGQMRLNTLENGSGIKRPSTTSNTKKFRSFQNPKETGFSCAYISPGVQNIVGRKMLKDQKQVKVFKATQFSEFVKIDKRLDQKIKSFKKHTKKQRDENIQKHLRVKLERNINTAKNIDTNTNLLFKRLKLTNQERREQEKREMVIERMMAKKSFHLPEQHKFELGNAYLLKADLREKKDLRFMQIVERKKEMQNKYIKNKMSVHQQLLYDNRFVFERAKSQLQVRRHKVKLLKTKG